VDDLAGCPRIAEAAVPGGSQPAVALVVVFVKELPDMRRYCGSKGCEMVALAQFLWAGWHEGHE
jgi:hypothetical protein